MKILIILKRHIKNINFFYFILLWNNFYFFSLFKYNFGLKSIKFLIKRNTKNKKMLLKELENLILQFYLDLTPINFNKELVFNNNKILLLMIYKLNKKNRIETRI
jgi:hypothetical protein